MVDDGVAADVVVEVATIASIVSYYCFFSLEVYQHATD